MTGIYFIFILFFYFFDQRKQYNTSEAEELIKNRHKMVLMGNSSIVRVVGIKHRKTSIKSVNFF